MTTETDKSQGYTTVVTSITRWSSFRAVIPTIIEVTGTEINLNDYEDRLTYIGDDGVLTIDGVCAQTGVVHWVIKNKIVKTSAEETILMDNPKDIPFKEALDNVTALINTEAELAFMKHLKLDVRDDSGVVGNSTSRRLMTLLNNYRIGDGWTANPSDGCTTAYFVPRYYGAGANAPAIYNFNPDARLVVVLELMMYGEYKTHALVVR